MCVRKVILGFFVFNNQSYCRMFKWISGTGLVKQSLAKLKHWLPPSILIDDRVCRPNRHRKRLKINISSSTHLGLGGLCIVFPSFLIALHTAFATVSNVGVSFSLAGVITSRSNLIRSICKDGVQERMMSTCGLTLPVVRLGDGKIFGKLV